MTSPWWVNATEEQIVRDLELAEQELLYLHENRRHTAGEILVFDVDERIDEVRSEMRKLNRVLDGYAILP